MKFFEYHFNPKTQQDIMVDTFCFKPSAKESRHKGQLFGVIKWKISSAQDKNLGPKLFQVLQNQYYKQGFAQALAEANTLLFHQHNRPILGNLEMALACITPHLELKVSQTRDLTALLQRHQEIFDLSAGQQTKPNPGRAFSNVMSGSLRANDRLLFLTPGLSKTLQDLNILQTLCQAKKARSIKKIFKYKKSALRNVFGACLIIQVKKPWLSDLRIPKLPIKIPKISLDQNPRIKQLFLTIIILALVLTLGYLLFN